MKRLILVLFCLLALPVVASHIVGGEFEIVHVSGTTYRVNLIVYFDKRNGNPQAFDQSVTARIFRKSDNAVMRTIVLSYSSQTPVEYTNPTCASADLQTSRIIYTSQIDMSAQVYNDPQGYYISWERCCRNYTINNIYSLDPSSGGQYAGQTFYLEFPAVVKNGQPFINSTPRLFPPLSDYACVRYPYYVDFGGVDDDNDSLVYSLANPLNTISGDALPPGGFPRPAPYPDVVWRSPYGLDNVMGGRPDLVISKEGLLTVTPRTVGLFVFAVRCEEFRDGIKIGETRRDFQMLAVDCKMANPPEIKGKKLTDTNYTYKDYMNVSFTRTVPDADRCVEVQVSDIDINNKDDGYMENIRIRAIPMGFKADVSGILPTPIDATLTLTNSLAQFRICFDKCPYVNGPFTVGIIAYDDACALPLLDTIRITVNIEPPPNQKPRFILPTNDVTAQLQEGDPMAHWPVTAVDDDGDPMTFSTTTQKGVVLSNIGMKFTPGPQVGNTITGELTWDPDCKKYDFAARTEFLVNLLVEDQEVCNLPDPDIRAFDLSIRLPDNAAPIIDTDLTVDLAETRVDLVSKVFDVLTFNVVANDADGDQLTLGMEGVGFETSAYTATFPGDARSGRVASQFKWPITCDLNLEEKNEFTFRFVAIDKVNKCRIYQEDAVDVNVLILPPDNAQPRLQITSLLPGLKIEADNTVSILVNEQISVKLTGTDADTAPAPDLIKLSMIDAGGNVPPQGYIFDPVQGHNQIESVFSWKPECNIFTGDVFQNEYTFTFKITDDRCFNPRKDSTVLHVNIRDVDHSDKDFVPPNVITPNNDGCNDYFALEGFDESTSAACSQVHIPNLPLDNCVGHFLGIRIFNRWGVKLFESADRKFRWYASGEAMGTYYYYLSYSDKEYKGVISVTY